MISEKFIGTGVAVTTPFKNNLSVDYGALKKHISFLLQNGINYFVVLGTTGESVTLSDEEKQQVLNTFIQVNDGKLPIVYGIGGNNTRAVTEKVKKTDLHQVDGILSVAP